MQELSLEAIAALDKIANEHGATISIESGIRVYRTPEIDVCDSLYRELVQHVKSFRGCAIHPPVPVQIRREGVWRGKTLNQLFYPL